MGDVWERLLPRLHEWADIGSALKLLNWDQQVMLPPRAAPGRGRVMGTLQSIEHSRLSDPRMGELLEEAQQDDSLDESQRAAVWWARRFYDKATKLPEPLVRELAELSSITFQAWTEARPANDFSLLEKHLTRLIDLKKQAADAIGWEGERYDALIDDFEPEMTTVEVETLFDELVPALAPLTEKILSAAGERPAFLSRTYEVDKQENFSRWLVQAMGFDMSRGRFDVSPHPFTQRIAASDVRQTSKYQSQALMMGIRASMHETGHALYEQGLPDELWGLPTGEVWSLALHESQSRIWEIQVGTSRPFVEFMLPHLKDRFPEELGSLSPDDFYRGVNHPRRSLIRVHSDELTYNLHIALRFELELALFRDELDVSDLPDAFDAAMEKHVGIRPDTDTDGVLQDMHWSVGAFGYFPTYTLGTLYAAALFDTATQELGDLGPELRRGETQRLLTWLREKIHARGSIRSAKGIATDVIGAPLSPEPFLSHLRRKYGELYDVQL